MWYDVYRGKKSKNNAPSKALVFVPCQSFDWEGIIPRKAFILSQHELCCCISNTWDLPLCSGIASTYQFDCTFCWSLQLVTSSFINSFFNSAQRAPIWHDLKSVVVRWIPSESALKIVDGICNESDKKWQSSGERDFSVVFIFRNFLLCESLEITP